MHEQVSGGLTALPPDGSGGERGDKGGEPLPPAPMKKQEARPPPLQFPTSPSVALPVPAGWGMGRPRAPMGAPGLAREGACRPSLPNEPPSSGRGSELRTQRMGRVWDSALRHPSPTGSRALPAEAAGEAQARGRPGWGKGEGKREGRPRSPPRGPSATCPPPPTAAPPAPRAAAGAALSAPFTPRCP